MKQTLALALLAAFTAPVAAQQTFHANPEASTVEWVGKKVTGQHNGELRVQQGTITWGEEGLSGAHVVMDMASITVLDLKPEGAAKLEGHLRSTDFFNTAEFGTATFSATRVQPKSGAAAGAPNYTVTGNLTIKGITKPVTFDVLASKEQTGVRASGTLVFDRTHYDIKYRSGQFFDALGDRMIEDEVALTFNLTATEQ